MELTTILICLLVLAIGLIYILFKKKKEVQEDLDNEIERSLMLRDQLAVTKELQNKAVAIDHKIEVKKNERKKLSKKDKLAAANNRH